MSSLLGCDSWVNSGKPILRATLSASISISNSQTDTTTSSSRTATYNASGSALSKTWTRQTYFPGLSLDPDNPDGYAPSDGFFFLMTKCCCWRCQLMSMITTNAGTFNTVFQATFEETDFNGNVIGSGSMDLPVSATLIFPTDNSVYCNSPRAGRSGQLVVFGGGVGLGPYSADNLTYGYADSAGRSDSFPVTQIEGVFDGSMLFYDHAGSLHTPPYGTVAASSCDDSFTVSASATFSGTSTNTTDPTITKQNISNALLTVSLAFS